MQDLFFLFYIKPSSLVDWMTAFVPETGKNFKSTFLYENGFKANYIINEPVNISKSSTGANELRLFI